MQMNRRSPSNEGYRGAGRRDWITERPPERERLERDSFILLQHAYTLTGADPSVPVNPMRLGCELGFAHNETSRLVRYLSWVGYLKESAAGPHLALAPEGIDYLERGARRRHTVRADELYVPIRAFLD
jgi:hypothetical protein